MKGKSQSKWLRFLITLLIGLGLLVMGKASWASQDKEHEAVGDETIQAENCPLPVLLENELEEKTVLKNLYCELRENTLIIKGKVHNLSHTVLSGVEVEAALVGAGNAVLARQDVLTVPEILRSKRHKFGYFTIKLPYFSKARKIILKITAERQEVEED
ncbi:hypothetical protein [Thermosulfurimonas dismutans]|uniref:Uncharacterized protein n=1 Tax=Thermosulfurimonas dismutans TaxID=999894 RepID=A0A179D2D4_9BACT|nr:hypothetical protein [Thermosulfurimonas dismutans]OAQ20153.1 hypothetical protein TDIS_1779 [Thermosulfurimonas dismutans]